MNAEKDKINTLRPFKEYRKMRQEAISKLANCQEDDERTCIVDEARISLNEKDELLDQLLNGYKYLNIPIELFLISDFWKKLKKESEKSIRFVKFNNTKLNKPEQEDYDLMSVEEYKKLRQEAINKLLNCQQFNEDYCIVDKIRVRIDEKDAILNLLQDDYEYFRVPLPLYFTSMFWRTLKVESNRRICHIIMEDVSPQKKL